MDQDPVETNRDQYLKRTLTLELHFDELEQAFREKALVDRDLVSGVLLVEVSEREATLHPLNAPLGHAVHVVKHPPANHSQAVPVASSQH